MLVRDAVGVAFKNYFPRQAASVYIKPLKGYDKLTLRQLFWQSGTKTGPKNEAGGPEK